MADFKAIETFMWVATLGSFRGAAQRLNTTQPAISQRIAQLEREVGVKLLQRDRRMVLPTPSGRQMMVYAEKLIGLRSEMLAAVGDRSAMHGVLRLGVAETIVHTWLSQLGSWPALRSGWANETSRCMIWQSFRSSPFRARPRLTNWCARCSTARTCRRCGCMPAPRWLPSSTWRSKASALP